MLTSIIVPLWNHLKDLTIPWVESMRQCSGNWELILVDNGSTDGTAEFIQQVAREDKRIIPVISKNNLGFGGGNNLGYKRATGDEICFISNDVLLHDKDWVVKFQVVTKQMPKTFLGPQYVDFNLLTSINGQPTPYLAGWCLYGPKALFEAMRKENGTRYTRPQIFDESFGLAYFEDVFMSVQAVKLGYKLHQLPLQLQHLVSKSSDQIKINETMLKAQKVFRNKMMFEYLEKKHTKRIVFFCPGVPYGFTSRDYEGKGVGGAEASLILLTRELAKLGYVVEVYNRTLKTGNYDGVKYCNIDEFDAGLYCDVFILFRAYHPVLQIVNAIHKVFWSCDQATDISYIWNQHIFPHVDKVVAISPYHQDYLKKNYKIKKDVQVIDLGIKGEDYQKPVNKIPGKAIYCSVPMRGLDWLAKMVPEIKRQVPEFNLVITSDYRLWGLDDPRNEEHKQLWEGLPYVQFLGKIPRDVLVKHQLEAEVMAYPCTYPECFCIAAMECMAAGAVPVTTSIGAMPTTVDKGGLVLSNGVSTESYIRSLVGLLKDKTRLEKYREQGYQIAKAHDWTLIVQEWVKLFNKLEAEYG